MKLLTSDKKKLLALLILSALLCLGAASVLSTRVYEISEYFGTGGGAAQPGQEGGGTGDGIPTTVVNTGKKGATPPPSYSNGKRPVSAQEIPINPSVIGELPVNTPKESGIVKRTSVEMPPSATSWTQEGKRPVVGDILRITIPNAHEYLVRVVAFTVNADSMSVTGNLEKEDGECYMHAIEGSVSIRLVDRTNVRVYNVFYHTGEKVYTVEEIDPTLIPPSLD